ncbi:MAG: DUF4835 family protein [Bacteroidota bacterium]|nr:DUF4835 family protein [Bacteroidota bacterium]
MFRFIFMVFAASIISYAQIDCDVTVNLDQISSAKDRLQTLEHDLESYVNSQKWSTDDLNGEKIRCTINIFITGAADPNSYTAQAFIGSSRPVFVGKNPSAKSTPMVRVFDEKWEFTYVSGQPLYRNETQYDALTDFLDFYMYTIIGFDYDSYQKSSGTPYFRKAFTICNQAPSNAKGWERGSGSTYAKYNLLEELLNPNNQLFREGWYSYHYRGLDLLATKPDKGFENIQVMFNNIKKIKETSNPRTILFKSFFDTKYGEIADVFKNYSDKSIFQLLIQLDQAHQTAYEEAARGK